jgi:hypothetical protein
MLCFTLVGLAGPLSIYFGYRLILLGVVENGFKFTAGMSAWELGLAGSSPGLLLALFGTFICWVGLKNLTTLMQTEYELQRQGVETATSAVVSAIVTQPPRQRKADHTKVSKPKTYSQSAAVGPNPSIAAPAQAGAAAGPASTPADGNASAEPGAAPDTGRM